MSTALASFMRAGSKMTANVEMIIIAKQAHVMRRLFVWYVSLSGIISFIDNPFRDFPHARDYKQFSVLRQNTPPLAINLH
jgi:hypothetical protein